MDGYMRHVKSDVVSSPTDRFSKTLKVFQMLFKLQLAPSNISKLKLRHVWSLAALEAYIKKYESRMEDE